MVGSDWGIDTPIIIGGNSIDWGQDAQTYIEKHLLGEIELDLQDMIYFTNIAPDTEDVDIEKFKEITEGALNIIGQKNALDFLEQYSSGKKNEYGAAINKLKKSMAFKKVENMTIEDLLGFGTIDFIGYITAEEIPPIGDEAFSLEIKKEDVKGSIKTKVVKEKNTLKGELSVILDPIDNIKFLKKKGFTNISHKVINTKFNKNEPSVLDPPYTIVEEERLTPQQEPITVFSATDRNLKVEPFQWATPIRETKDFVPNPTWAETKENITSDLKTIFADKILGESKIMEKIKMIKEYPLIDFRIRIVVELDGVGEEGWWGINCTPHLNIKQFGEYNVNPFIKSNTGGKAKEDTPYGYNEQLQNAITDFKSNYYDISREINRVEGEEE